MNAIAEKSVICKPVKKESTGDVTGMLIQKQTGKRKKFKYIRMQQAVNVT